MNVFKVFIYFFFVYLSHVKNCLKRSLMYTVILLICQVFTSLSLFVMLISPLNAFPWVLNGLMEAWVSLKRVQSFVQLKESQLDAYYKEMNGKL